LLTLKRKRGEKEQGNARRTTLTSSWTKELDATSYSIGPC